MSAKPSFRHLTLATLLLFASSCVIVRSAPYPSSQPKVASHRPKSAKPKPAKPKPAKPKPTTQAPKPGKPPGTKPKPQPGPGKPAQPRPQPQPPAPEPEAPPSIPNITQMVVPVRVDFSDAVAKVDGMIQKTLKQDWHTVSAPNAPTKIEVRYTVWRDPIKASFADGTLKVTANVRYAADVRASMKMGRSTVWLTKGETWGTKADPQKIAAKFHAKFKIDDDFSVKADAELDDIDYGPAPSGQLCVKALAKVCISKESIAPMVNKNLEKALVPKIQKALNDADKQFEKAMNLKKQATTLWTAMQQPQPLQRLGQANCPSEFGAVCSTPAWLLAKPASVGVSQPRMDGDDLRIDIGLAGQLAVKLGDMPAVKPTPLPKLQDVTEPPGFAVRAKLKLPLASLNEELSKRLNDVKLGGRGVPEIVVDKVTVLDEFDVRHPHRLSIAVSVSGALKGDLKLRGELVWNSRKSELSLQNFDYTVDTDNEALKKLSDSHYEQLRKLVAEKARWKLDTRAAALSNAVTGALGKVLRGKLQVNGSLDEIHLDEFAVKDGALDAEVVLAGKLDVALNP